MAKTRQQKQAEVQRLTKSFQGAKSAVFTTFDGLNVADNQELRSKLRQEQVDFQVSKKTLLKKALTDAKVEGVEINDFKGNIAVAFAKDDEVAPARILNDFAKKHEQLQLQSGLLEGQIITLEKVKELATLPSRIELIAMTVATIQAPISGFVNVLAGNIRGLLNVLNGIKETKNQ